MLWTAAVLAALGPSVAVADTDASRALIEEVISTARQRHEPLQQIPVAATAFNTAMLERYALDDLQQVAQKTPNLIATYGGTGGAAALFLRGVGTNADSTGFESAIGIVIDGVHHSRGRYIQQGFFDLEQVEILKGPQALYFGKNNSAGLIVLRTKSPGTAFEAHARAGYELEASEVMAEAGMSVTVSEKAAFRIAAKWSDMRGWARNLSQPIAANLPFWDAIPGASQRHAPNKDEVLGRFTLRLTPDDRLEAILKVSGARNRDSGQASTTQLSDCNGPGGRPQRIHGFVPSPWDDCVLNGKVSHSSLSPALFVGEPEIFGDGRTFTDYHALTTSLETTYRFDAATLTSVTAYQRYGVEGLENYTFSDDGQLAAFDETRYDAFSQELRLVTDFDGPVNVLLGALHARSDLYYRGAIRLGPYQLSGMRFDPATGRQFTFDKHSNTAGETWSAYAEAQWDVTPVIELSGGARYTREVKTFEMIPDFIHPLALDVNGGSLSGNSYAGRFTDDNVSPQVTLTWRPLPAATFYAAYKTGFKSGGFDSSYLLGTGVTVDDLTFGSEKAKGFEAGAKMALFDGALRLGGVAYSYVFDDLQVQQFSPQTAQFNVTNAGRARTRGIEAEFAWAAWSGVNLFGSIGYNDATYREFIAGCYSGQSIQAGCSVFLGGPGDAQADAQDLAGRRLARAPRWVLALGASHTVSLSERLGATLTLDGRYAGGYSANVLAVPEAARPSSFLLDATMQLFHVDETWEVALIGRNLTNTKVVYVAGERPRTGGAYGYDAESPLLGNRSDTFARLERGRQVWVRLTWRFH